MNRGGRGYNHNKKRPRNNSAWAPYYAAQRQNRRDRYAELDPSNARAINAPPQSRLARNRRQTADNHWESSSNKNNDDDKKDYAEDIFEDLMKPKSQKNITTPHAANARIRARKSFWKRELSTFSTKDFDAVWRVGRNKFLGERILDNLVKGHQNTVRMSGLCQVTCTFLHFPDRKMIEDCNHQWERVFSYPKQEFETLWNTARNKFLGTIIYDDLVSSHSGKLYPNKSFIASLNPNPAVINSRKTLWKKHLSDLSTTEEFDAVWKEGRNRFFKDVHGHGSGSTTSSVAILNDDNRNLQKHSSSVSEKRNTAKDGAKQDKAANGRPEKSSKTVSAKKNIIEKGQDRKSMQKAAKPISSTAFSNTSEIRPSITNNQEVIDLCDSDSDDEIEIQGAATSSGLGSSEHKTNLPRAKQELDTCEETTTAPKAVSSVASMSTEPSTSPVIATAKNPKKTKTPSSNRWSKLFLGPEFRTENVFSLDQECFGF